MSRLVVRGTTPYCPRGPAARRRRPEPPERAEGRVSRLSTLLIIGDRLPARGGPLYNHIARASGRRTAALVTRTRAPGWTLLTWRMATPRTCGRELPDPRRLGAGPEAGVRRWASLLAVALSKSPKRPSTKPSIEQCIPDTGTRDASTAGHSWPHVRRRGWHRSAIL